MKIHYSCYPCLLNQVISLAKLTGLTEEATEDVVQRTMHMILEGKARNTPQHLVRRVYDYLHYTYFKDQDNFDPYRGVKDSSNRQVLEYLPEMRDRIARASDPLGYAIRVAAAGNIIDFGPKPHSAIDIAREIEEIPRLVFAVDHLPLFRKKLEEAKTILYITDNAGEILFDQLLIEELHKERPEAKLVVALREKPIINDATPEDSFLLELPDNVPMISSGSIYPGTVIPETTEEFRSLYENADLIIAKGQGNFETLEEAARPGLFFILRIKCDRVAGRLGAPVGQLVLEEAVDSR